MGVSIKKKQVVIKGRKEYKEASARARQRGCFFSKYTGRA